MSTKKASVQIFIAYSQKDRIFLDGLRNHISPLLRKGNVIVWFDGEIRAGEKWDDAIKTNLYAADIILMLLSANSLASDYFYEQEVKDALERHHAGTARVIPILCAPCLWQETPLADIQGLPRGMKPVTAWRNFDEAWNDVVLNLRNIIQEIEKGTAEKTALEAPEPSQPVQSSTKTATAAEEHAWEFTSDTNTRAAYQKYLDRFPQGFYSDKARDFLEYFDADDTAWEFANDVGTDQAIQKYIKKYPKGLHTEAARKRIDPFSEHMVLIKGGTFEMGDVFGEGAESEKSVHKVMLDDFMMCKYPVTQGLWKAVMGQDTNPSHFKGDDMLPVENVSWDMVQEFMEVLNKKSGASYRLPTEAEWEYAARERGKKVRFGNGKDIADPAEMNFNALEKYKQPYSVAGTYREKTTPVDLFKPNALGLYDMSGNVWELCADYYAVDHYQQCQQQGTALNPKGPETGALRVLRGGSWFIKALHCRTTTRASHKPTARSSNFGFRLVLSALPV